MPRVRNEAMTQAVHNAPSILLLTRHFLRRLRSGQLVCQEMFGTMATIGELFGKLHVQTLTFVLVAG
jgi:hypothetical protein